MNRYIDRKGESEGEGKGNGKLVCSVVNLSSLLSPIDGK
jgi:hypothetical protein